MSVRYPSAVPLVACSQKSLWQVSTKQHVGTAGWVSGLGTFPWFSKKIKCHVKRMRVRRKIFTLVGIQVQKSQTYKAKKSFRIVFFSGVLRFQRFLQISYILERINHYLLISFVQNNQILKQEISVWFLILAWSPMYLFMILPVTAKPGSGPRVLLASCQTPSKTTATLWPGGSAPEQSLILSLR